MATFRSFDRYLKQYIANAPNPAIDDALLDAAIDFCDRTRVINGMTERLPVVAGSGEVEVDAPDSNLVVANVIAVYTTARKLTSKTKSELDQLYPKGWMWEEASEASRILYWLAQSRATITLVPYPTFNSGQEVVAEAAYKPARAAASLPDDLLEHYAEAIAAGALARLHSHPGAAYADSARAGGFATMFEAYIAKHADEHLSGVGKPHLRTGTDEFQ
jgi:hypothetical protein